MDTKYRSIGELRATRLDNPVIVRVKIESTTAERLRVLAYENRTSASELIRIAIARFIEDASSPQAPQPKPKPQSELIHM